MAAGKQDGKIEAARHVYGPRAVGTLMPGLTRAAFKARSPAAAQIMADWPMLMGPQLAATTAPRKLQGGTLTIGCTGPVAMELQHVANEIVAQLNQALGRNAVQRLRFVQDFTPPPAPPTRLPAPPPEPVAGLEQGDLHDALAALGSAIRAARQGA